MNSTDVVLTPQQCMSFLSVGTFLEGWALFMFIMLLVIFFSCVVVIVVKHRGIMCAENCDQTLMIIKSIALFLFFVAMCRNLHQHISQHQIMFCDIPLEVQSCRDITEPISSWWMKGYLVINFMCSIVTLVGIEVVRYRTQLDYLELRKIACSSSTIGFGTKVWEVVKFIGFRQMLWLVPAAFSPGFAVLEAIPLSRDCMVDANIPLLIDLAVAHFSIILTALFFWLVELFLQHRGCDTKFAISKFCVIIFPCAGVVMFFIQMFASLQSIFVVRSYVLTAGFAPLISLFNGLLWIIEWIYVAQFTAADDFRSALLLPVRTLTEELRDEANFRYVRDSFRDAMVELDGEIKLPKDWIEETTPKVKQNPAVHKYQLTTDEALAIYAYTTNLLYDLLNRALRSFRHQDTYSTLWESKKHAYLPYIYLLYSAVSKLPRADGPILFRGYTWFSNDPVKLEPYSILGKLQPIANICSSSRDRSVADRFASHPYPFFQEIQTSSLGSKARQIDAFSMLPDEVERLFPCDCEFQTTEVASKNTQLMRYEAKISETDRPDLDWFSIFDEPAYQLWITTNQGNMLPENPNDLSI